jgi:peptidoglycan/xylan/chitin deacetylase (PgdA/CDA1 family)
LDYSTLRKDFVVKKPASVLLLVLVLLACTRTSQGFPTELTTVTPVFVEPPQIQAPLSPEAAVTAVPTTGAIPTVTTLGNVAPLIEASATTIFELKHSAASTLHCRAGTVNTEGCVLIDPVQVLIINTAGDKYATGRVAPEKPATGDNRVSWDTQYLRDGTEVVVHGCYLGSHGFGNTRYRAYVAIRDHFVWVHAGVLERNPCEKSTQVQATPTVVVDASPHSTPDENIPDEAVSNGGAIYFEHGDRTVQNVAVGIDLCQSKEVDLNRYPDRELFNYLVENQISATWFISGLFAQAHSDYIGELSEYPFFEIANHGWSHRNDQVELFSSDPDGFDNEILWTQAKLEELTGELPDKYRPPAGNGFGYNTQGIQDKSGWNREVALRVNSLGLKPVTWDVISGDPKYYGATGLVEPSASQIAHNVLDQVQRGSIIVMHGNGQGVNTAASLQLIVPILEEQGYEFVTVGQMALVPYEVP